MLNVKTSAVGIYRISEGNPESSMLYRYGILKKYEEKNCDCECTVTDGTISLHAKRDVVIFAEKRQRGYKLTIPMSKCERFFGMGDATRKYLQMRGQKINIDVKNVVAYGPMPIFLSTDGWALLLNCTYRSIFDFGSDGSENLTINVLGGGIEFYLFTADSMKALLGKVTEISGKPCILPKFAYGLTFVQNEEADARSLLCDIRTIRDRNIPCDTMGLEPSWMEQRYDYSVNKKWNSKKFYLPHWLPENNSDHFTFFYPMRKMGMQLSLWLCENYDLLYAEDNAVGTLDENEFTEDAVILDDNFSTDVRIDNMTKLDMPWFEHLKKFVDNGAASFKLDGSTQVINHPDRLWGEKYLDEEVHNVYPVLLAKQTTVGFRDYTDRRLLLYTAAAYAGTQQYAATWAGDTGGGPKTVTAMLNYSMCGHSNTSCDIDVTPEGIHYGFLLPWSQYFCWANWKYPWFMDDKTEDMIRFYSNLRSTLIPYIYTMAHKAYETGICIVRPLPLIYEETDRFDNVKNAYMLGDSLYVGVFDMNIKLPEGTWIDYFTEEKYSGDIEYKIPTGKGGALLVKEGSVIVTMKPQKYVLEKQHDYIIGVYPGADASFCLYEDDGFTYDYEKGFYAETLIETKNTTDSGFELIINPRKGGFPGRPDNGHNEKKNSIPEIKAVLPEKDMVVEIHGKMPKKIVYQESATKIAFEYDGTKAVFVAPTSSRGDAVIKYSVIY